MARAARRGIFAVITALFLLALGVGGAVAAGDAGGILAEGAGSATVAWCARALLVLAVAWIVIGMFAARTRLVRRPGAAAARVSWIAATRPWRARESTLGMLPLDRWLLIVVPGALLVATRVVQTAFLGWVNVGLVLTGWLAFALVVRIIVGRRSPWPVIAAVGGAVVLRCILTLAALSFTGPDGHDRAFWADPWGRGVYITVAVALFLWAFVAAGWSLTATLGARRATGAVLAAVGTGLAIPAILVAGVGFEALLVAWDDELGVLPWGLSRIVGATADIPSRTPWLAAAFGASLAVTGALLALPSRRRRRDDRSNAVPNPTSST